MIRDISQWIRSKELIRPGCCVYAAVSGGADSVCMLLVLHELRNEFDFSLHAVHVNHHLRGGASDADEAFVVSLCRQLDIPLQCRDVDVQTYCERFHVSLEEAARILRYGVFSSLPGLVATAHTADDNAETVLMNLIRGTGLKGLCGIPEKRDNLIRPMLCCTRTQIEQFLCQQHQGYCTDATNGDDFALRNRVRHHIMPLLLAENPNFQNTVSRMTALLQEDEQLLSLQARQLLKQAEVSAGYDCTILKNADPCIRKRALRELLSRYDIPKVSMTHVHAVDRLICGELPSGQTDLPGHLVARRQYSTIRIGPRKAAAPLFPCQLTDGMVFTVQDRAYRLHCERRILDAVFENTECRFAIRCNTDDSLPYVRSRMPGDSMRLSGGTKKINRIMIDRKIPVCCRDQLPVILDARGVLAVFPIGIHSDFSAVIGEEAWMITVEEIERKEETKHDPSL